MTKLVVGIVLTVLVLGCAMYAYGNKIVPSVGTAGNRTKTQIDAAFQ